MNKMETWRDIVGYEGLYQVSSLGRVKSISREVKRNSIIRNKHLLRINERYIAISKDKKGYCYVQLWKNDNRKRCAVHRLVASAFIPNLENKPEVDHIDTNPSNNNVDNLKWVTSYENAHNPITETNMRNMLRPPRGREYANKVRRRFSKAVAQFSMDNNLIKTFSSSAEAERSTGVRASHICECRRGERKQAGGYIWKNCGVKEE